MNEKQNGTTTALSAGLEAPAYPSEFLHVMADYAYENLRACLDALQVEQPVLDLLDNLMVLKTSELYMKARAVKPHYNEATGEAIASVSRSIVRLGGAFCGPETQALVLNLQDMISL